MKSLSFSIAVVAVLLTVPMFTSADQSDLKSAPYQEPINTKTIPYVDEILITPVPEYEPAYGKPLSAALVQNISRLAGVSLTYVRNGDGYHLFQLPKKGYEAEAEALCEKIRKDARIKWCSLNAMGYGASVTAPTDPFYTSGQPSKAAPSQPPIGPRSTLLDVDQLMINVMPGYEPAGGKPLPAALINKISELAGVRITYVRNSDEIHLFQLPSEIYGPDAEALCEKIRQDVRIKWCTPSYMAVGQSATAPNDPKFLNSEQWNLSHKTATERRVQP